MSDSELRQAFKDLPRPPSPATGAELRAAHRRRVEARARRQRVSWLGPGLAAAACLTLLVWVPSVDPPSSGQLRARAVGDEVVGLAVDLLLDAPEPVPAQDSAVSVERGVLVRATVTRSGFLCLRERSDAGWRTLHPAPGDRWAVEAGSHVPNGPRGPLALRGTDPGPREYRVEFDPQDPACAGASASTGFSIDWREPTP